MRSTNSTVCKEHDAGLTRNLSTAFKVKLKRLWCRRFCVTWQWMSLEPVQSNPCEVESKSSRGWIFTLTLCGVAACASRGARIGILQIKGQAWVFVNRTLLALWSWSTLMKLQLTMIHVKRPWKVSEEAVKIGFWKFSTISCTMRRL